MNRNRSNNERGRDRAEMWVRGIFFGIVDDKHSREEKSKIARRNKAVIPAKTPSEKEKTPAHGKENRAGYAA